MSVCFISFMFIIIIKYLTMYYLFSLYLLQSKTLRNDKLPSAAHFFPRHTYVILRESGPNGQTLSDSRDTRCVILTININELRWNSDFIWHRLFREFWNHQRDTHGRGISHSSRRDQDIYAHPHSRLCDSGAMTLNYPLTTLEGIKSVGLRNFAAPSYDASERRIQDALKM